MKRLRTLGALGPALVTLVLLGLFFKDVGPTALANPGGLLNPGFEDGLANWTPTSVADSAQVVGAEGPAQFATYADMGNVTVNPYRGDFMLRLGTPKQISQKQPSGDNSVSQTFTSERDTLEFAFRLFSWEHRGNDLFGFSLTNQTGQSVGQLAAPLVVHTQDGSTLGCTTLPCQFGLDVGRRGDFLDSDWVRVSITGIPVGEDLTLTYTVGGTDNEAHGTWGYFDNVNTPPVAKFSILPADPSGPDDLPRFEGNVMQLVDQSTDAEGPDDIVSWEWSVTGPGVDGAQTSRSQSPFFIPPNQGTYLATLTVTDTGGESDTVSSGGVARDGTAVAALTVQNAPPMVNALNVEVLEGDDVPLVGRFLDAGWLDAHAGQWEVGAIDRDGDGSEGTTVVPGAVQEDHTPALGTGLVTGSLGFGALGEALPGDRIGGALRVGDQDGGSSDDLFVITVDGNDPNNREPNDSLADPPILTSDGAYLSYIQSQGDADIFKVEWPGAVQGQGTEPGNSQQLPPGSEVLVTLRGRQGADASLPADYDLIVLTKQPATAPYSLSPFSLSPFSLSPYSLSPYSLSPYSLSPYSMSPYSLSPYSLSPYSLSPYSLSPYSLSPYSLSPYSLSPFSLSPYSLSPYSLSPFSLSPFSLSPYSLSPFSLSPYSLGPFSLSPLSGMAFTGLGGDEISGTDIDFSELGLSQIASGDVKVAGFSANRGVTPETVLVRVDAPGTEVFAAVVGANGAHSQQPYALQLEASMPFDQAALGTELAAASCQPRAIGSPTAAAVMHPKSGPLTLFVTQAGRLGGDAAFWNKMAELADDPKINGKIISVDSSIYGPWDDNPCSVEAANAVTEEVRNAILSEIAANESIQYVVVLGGDDIIPHRRVVDETTISNESYYLLSSFLKPGTPLFESVRQGYNLTDDFYVDLEPSPWQGRALFIPDFPLGRMVETPADIAAAADAFLLSGGQLNPSTGFASGYDFFADGSNLMADALSTGVTVDRLINDTWSADDLRCRFLGTGSGCGGNVSGVNAVNAHFTHYAALSSGGFNQVSPLDQSDFITSAEVAAAGGGGALEDRIAFSMGCHAGLNVPAGSALAADPGLGIDPELDFVQAMAMQRAIYVASTGYGLGDTVVTAGTEQLMVDFSQELMNPGATAGQALVEAKQSYLGGLSAMTYYDEKSAIQTTLYGLPQYEVLGAPAVASAQASGVTMQLSSDVVTVTPTFSRQSTADGEYFTVAGDAQSTAGRPIQPRVVFGGDAIGPGDPVHGLLLTGGSFTDEAGFDPVISRPTIEWEASSSEPQICLPSLWPAELANVNTLHTPGGLNQTLAIVPGQFKCTSGAAATVTGVQRLFSNLNFEMLRTPDVSDFDPPVVTSLDLASGNSLDVTVAASDASGIQRIVVLVVEAAGQLSVAGDLSLSPPLPTSGEFTVNIPEPGSADALIVQVVDGVGNVATATAKGANLRVVRVDAGPDQLYTPGAPVTFAATVNDFAALTPPVFFSWDFGDGTSLSGLLAPEEIRTVDVTTDPSGNASFTVQHVYSDEAPSPLTATLKVTDSEGGIGVDRAALRRCSDPGDAVDPNADLVQCGVDNTAATMTITMGVAGVISSDFQYRIKMDIGTFAVDPGTGTTSLVSKQLDGTPDLHLRYNDGKVTGLPNLVVTVSPDGKALTFAFPLTDIDRGSGDDIQWFGQTQAGVEAEPETGIVDEMPDSGFIEYVLR